MTGTVKSRNAKSFRGPMGLDMVFVKPVGKSEKVVAIRQAIDFANVSSRGKRISHIARGLNLH